MSTPPSEYASFLVRLWREGNTNAHQVPGNWQGEVEHIQSGQRLIFCTWDELLNHLQQQTSAGEKGNK